MDRTKIRLQTIYGECLRRSSWVFSPDRVHGECVENTCNFRSTYVVKRREPKGSFVRRVATRPDRPPRAVREFGVRPSGRAEIRPRNGLKPGLPTQPSEFGVRPSGRAETRPRNGLKPGLPTQPSEFGVRPSGRAETDRTLPGRPKGRTPNSAVPAGACWRDALETLAHRKITAPRA